MPHPETEARMVDVTDKEPTDREAIAIGTVRMDPATRAAVTERRLDKGDALEVARIAGILAAKRTSELIPLCHPIAIGGIEVDLAEVEEGIEITATVRTTERTGVEMEALTAVSIAALTVYDMIKGVDRGASITDVRLLRKSGGKSGTWSAS
jgi:cyclic pyranopterin monophosphate synthase